MAHDPVNSARARIAYYSRQDAGDSERLLAARHEFALAKLERFIGDTLRATGPLSDAELRRFRKLLKAEPRPSAAA